MQQEGEKPNRSKKHPCGALSISLPAVLQYGASCTHQFVLAVLSAVLLVPSSCCQDFELLVGSPGQLRVARHRRTDSDHRGDVQSHCRQSGLCLQPQGLASGIERPKRCLSQTGVTTLNYHSHHHSQLPCNSTYTVHDVEPLSCFCA